MTLKEFMHQNAPLDTQDKIDSLLTLCKDNNILWSEDFEKEITTLTTVELYVPIYTMMYELRKFNREYENQVKPTETNKTIKINKLYFDRVKPYINVSGATFYYSGSYKFTMDTARAISSYFHPLKKNKKKRQIRTFNYPDVNILLNPSKNTFTFHESFDLAKYINMILKKIPTSPDNVTNDSTMKRVKLKSCNVEFYDGFYEVFATVGEIKNTSIIPKIIKNKYSSSSLNIIKAELVDRLCRNIYFFYNNKEVLGLNKELNLEECIEYIKRSNTDFQDIEYIIPSGIRSLNDCLSATKEPSFYKHKYNSSYLNYLFPLLGQEKLILAYENNHGKEEDAFIIPLLVAKKRIAIIFENISRESSTTTEVFITTKKMYSQCLQSVFDYFTNPNIEKKRYELRMRKRKPSAFQAIMYYYVDHDDFDVWKAAMHSIICFSR